MPDVPPELAPVHVTRSEGRRQPTTGTALCLSGGGYRAMLFHLGCLWRLNQAGWLVKLDRVSSVSGGSITAGVLAMNWGQLGFGAAGVAPDDVFQEQVVKPVRKLAGRTIDIPAILGALIWPRQGVGDRIAVSLDRKDLFAGRTLQDIPDERDGAPRFVINATNVGSGVLWRFSKPYMADYRVGEVKNPTVRLAVAVGASAAFPPFLSPVHLTLKKGECTPLDGADLHCPPYTTRVRLTDGGVYDNLGLETAFKSHKTLLVSDGGAKIADLGHSPGDWPRHLLRIMGVIDNQVRSLRKQQLIQAFKAKAQPWGRAGAYWGIRTHITEYGLADPMDCPAAATAALAAVPTRLKSLPATTQERLINWGYAVCDAALRTHVDPTLPKGTFPYPGGVG